MAEQDKERMTWGPESPVLTAPTLEEARRLTAPPEPPEETPSET